jgi:SM-20-related protein
MSGEGSREVYLNGNWSVADNSIATVIPSLGTIVVFLSEEFPHEVLPSKSDRYSIAGWFRLNNSISNKIGPPS